LEAGGHFWPALLCHVRIRSRPERRAIYGEAGASCYSFVEDDGEFGLCKSFVFQSFLGESLFYKSCFFESFFKNRRRKIEILWRRARGYQACFVSHFGVRKKHEPGEERLEDFFQGFFEDF
jgi:hypothetical protein